MEQKKKKRGSNVLVTCSICGKVLTKAGLIGHMRFKHGKDSRHPEQSVPRHPEGEAKKRLDNRLNDAATPCCQAAFEYVALVGNVKPFEVYRCSSCGSIWQASYSNGRITGNADGSGNLSFETTLTMLPYGTEKAAFLRWEAEYGGKMPYMVVQALAKAYRGIKR